VAPGPLRPEPPQTTRFTCCSRDKAPPSLLGIRRCHLPRRFDAFNRRRSSFRSHADGFLIANASGPSAARNIYGSLSWEEGIVG